MNETDTLETGNEMEWADEKKKEIAAKIGAAIMIAARAAHEVNRAYCEGIGDDSQVTWVEAPQWQRVSCINGVRAILQNPAITPAQQHALWMAEKGADGWVYGEEKDAEAKTHPCMVPYEELPDEQKVKDSLFGAAVRAVLGMSQ